MMNLREMDGVTIALALDRDHAALVGLHGKDLIRKRLTELNELGPPGFPSSGASVIQEDPHLVYSFGSTGYFAASQA